MNGQVVHVDCQGYARILEPYVLDELDEVLVLPGSVQNFETLYAVRFVDAGADRIIPSIDLSLVYSDVLSLRTPIFRLDSKLGEVYFV